MGIRILNYRESEGECQLCGKFGELRPYGPNKEWICFECGMKDEETTKAQVIKTIAGAGLVIIDERKNPRF